MADEKTSRDVESGKPKPIPHLKQVIDQGALTKEIREWPYQGSGTEDDPYIVTWIDHDPRNPMLYSAVKKWSLVALVAIATLAVSFVSSAYSGGTAQVIMEFGISEEVAILGVSLFVLGFAIGPLLWAPLSGECPDPRAQLGRIGCLANTTISQSSTADNTSSLGRMPC